MHVLRLADTIVVAKDVDAQSLMTLQDTIPGAINCREPRNNYEILACNDWDHDSDVVKQHVLVGNPKQCSGAHLMSLWNKGGGWIHPTKVGKTGIAGGDREFKAQDGTWCDLKFVWNDVSDIPPKDAHVYNLISGEVDDICRKAFYHARVKAGSNVPPPKRSYVVDTFNSPTMRGICVRAGYKGNVSETCFPDGSAAKNEKYEGDFC